MARIAAIVILALSGTLALPGSVSSQADLAGSRPSQPSGIGDHSEQVSLTIEQEKLVDHAVSRFDAQGLELPGIDYVFHTDLRPCHGHKGMYHKNTQTLEMCSMDLNTMLRELAHAWANVHLTAHQMEAFVSSRRLDSWNDHDHDWDRRGTEHVAETIAWALADDSHHVKWAENLPNGLRQTSFRILTIGVDVDTLLANFKYLTSMDPVFRHAEEWAVEEETSIATSPELARSGG